MHADSWMVMAARGMKMEEVTQRFGINISAKKSEILYIGRGVINVGVEDVQIRGQVMKTVEEFTYLGSVMASSGKFTQDIERTKSRSHQSVWYAQTQTLGQERC